jgi:hypothetical protein
MGAAAVRGAPATAAGGLGRTVVRMNVTTEEDDSAE